MDNSSAQKLAREMVAATETVAVRNHRPADNENNRHRICCLVGFRPWASAMSVIVSKEDIT